MKSKKTLLGVLVFIIGALVIFINPFKITDPSNPEFNPDKFSFNNYDNVSEMTDAFKKLFPVGTNKEFVDHVLIDAGGATEKKESSPLNGYTIVVYTEKYNPIRQFKEAAFHVFVFDSENKVKNIQPFARHDIYKDQITVREVLNKI